MKQYPSIPRLENAPEELTASGHLWILEKIDGAHLRFQLRESGAIRFGDRRRVYDDPEAIPEPYRHAVEHVRRRLDREALRGAVENVESVVFFGEATHRQKIDYEWDRLPSFLGFDVYSTDQEAFRPPGAVQGIFERLGLEPVNALERERNTRDFDSESYTVPESAWYDGPAAGVVIRNKRGGRAKLLHPDVYALEAPTPTDASAEEFADEYATDRRFETIRERLRDRGEPVSVETLYDRAMIDIAREAPEQLYGDASTVDVQAFRSAVAARARAFLQEAGE
jgi:hypothetical protein